jgi:hypothetical protein
MVSTGVAFQVRIVLTKRLFVRIRGVLSFHVDLLYITWWT